MKVWSFVRWRRRRRRISGKMWNIKGLSDEYEEVEEKIGLANKVTLRSSVRRLGRGGGAFEDIRR